MNKIIKKSLELSLYNFLIGISATRQTIITINNTIYDRKLITLSFVFEQIRPIRSTTNAAN